jgi:hypothetical protein
MKKSYWDANRFEDILKNHSYAEAAIAITIVICAKTTADAKAGVASARTYKRLQKPVPDLIIDFSGFVARCGANFPKASVNG